MVSARQIHRGIKSTVASFRQSDEGAAAVVIALTLPVLFGFAMLAVDGGRYFNLHTSVQAGADALALAGAAELDGKLDAITRANRAIDNLVANDQRFGEGTAQISRSRIDVRFLKSLPSTDGEAIAGTHVTADPAEAHFVEVATRPVPFKSYFAAVAAIRATSDTRATAVAGFDSVACKVAPLFMCNPFEGTGTNLYDGAQDPSFKRRLIAMKEKAATYYPGNYGYLQPPNGGGASEVKESMAIDVPKGCYRQSGVELRTGNISSTAEAMNVRFDLYDGGFKSNKSDPAYRPAQNVRKGFTGPSCNPSLAYDPTKAPSNAANANIAAIGFPRDECFYTSSCTYGGSAMGGRIGGGDWDFDAYWNVTYADTVGKPNGWSNGNRPSRYEVYRYEIENGLLNHASIGAGTKKGNGSTKETGAPQCYSGGSSTLSDVPDRRVFIGAILDCKALDEKYGINGGSSPPLPVTAYAKFFMTEPMDKNDSTIWVEMVEVLEPGTVAARGIVRDTVQLYR
jgi:Flp pilus assembly protein TadG